MKPASFDYFSPTTIEEALALLSEAGPEAKLLAGGQSLIPMMKLRLARPSVLVDINKVASLDYLKTQDACVAIGATRRLCTLNTEETGNLSGLFRAALPFIGHDATRHRGTVCGSLAHADPSAELPVIASCLDAEIVTRSATSQRTIKAEEFFISFFTTALDPSDMITEVRFPTLPPGTGWAFQEFSKRHAKFALAAVTLTRNSSSISKARIAMGAVGERPVRARAVEEVLEGAAGNGGVFKEAAAMVVADLEPPTDLHGSSEFRKKAVSVLVERALAQAWNRAA